MAAYAQRRHVFRHGLPRGTLGMPARVVELVSTATDLFELDGHGFEDGDELLVRALEGGTLPTPLVQNGTYYAKRISDSTFKVAATPSGAAIDLTGANGGQVAVATPLPFDATLEYFSRWVDGIIPHHVPLTPDDDGEYPLVVTVTVAKLTSRELQRLAGISSESMKEVLEESMTQVKAWAAGRPIRDARVTTSSNLAVTGTSTTARDPRGWGGTLP